jgi:hypothetical protein
MPRRARPTCRHCRRRPVGSPSGLCAACFARPEIRLLYQRGPAARPAALPPPRRHRPQKHPAPRGR